MPRGVPSRGKQRVKQLVQPNGQQGEAAGLQVPLHSAGSPIVASFADSALAFLQREVETEPLRSLGKAPAVLGLDRLQRLFALPAMIDGYLSALAQRRGEITAQVTAARSLSDGQQTALLEALRSAVGGKVQIDLKVDPALIGGLVVKVGSRMIDSSLRSKLQRLQLAMKGVG